MLQMSTIVSALVLVASCSDWLEPQSLGSDGTPGTEGGGMVYDKPSDAYAENIRQYFNTPHRVLHGWFGNWTGLGKTALTALPDSMDFVSLWGCRGGLSPEQYADLKAFQARGSRAVLCWRAGDIGTALTPEGANYADIWGFPAGSHNDVNKLKEGARRYAMAIVDTCRKYGINGFDYDYEDGGTLTDIKEVLNTFLLTLADEFDKDGSWLIVDFNLTTRASRNNFEDLTDEVSERCKYLIWQCYDYNDPRTAVTRLRDTRNHTPETNENAIKKSIFTWSLEGDFSTSYFTTGAQNLANMGIECGGVGAYHIEYDYDPDAGSTITYPKLRKCIAVLNPPIGVLE